MRYFLPIMGGVVISLFAGRAWGQVATMGGMANPSVPSGNLNMGANIANLGGNANLGSVRSGVGGGYGSTTQAAAIGSALAGYGGYPLTALDARYYSQNSGTVAGMYGTGAAIANQPGQPFGLNRYRSTFAGGAVRNYNPPVQQRFGGPFNGQGYMGQRFGFANSRGYNNYGGAAGAALNGGSASRFSNTNAPAVGGFSQPLNNGLPAYTSGQMFPGVWPGYAPYSPYRNSVPFSYPTTNGLAPGIY